jgi:hypothetical protein
MPHGRVDNDRCDPAEYEQDSDDKEGPDGYFAPER